MTLVSILLIAFAGVCALLVALDVAHIKPGLCAAVGLLILERALVLLV